MEWCVYNIIGCVCTGYQGYIGYECTVMQVRMCVFYVLSSAQCVELLPQPAGLPLNISNHDNLRSYPFRGKDSDYV